METGQSPRPGRRGRFIAVVAGAITVTAIVVAFAAEYFELPWKWLRPGVELLLLAELVGLVVLERRQLFEPVHEKVTGIEASMADLRATLNELRKQLAATGQVTLAVGVRETLQLRTRLLQEALERDQGGPQVIRIALLSGSMVTQDTRELGDELEVFVRTMSQFRLLAGSPTNSKGHRWSLRTIMAWGTEEAFRSGVEYLRSITRDEPLNEEFKILVRARPEGLIAPTLISDRDVFLGYGDETTPHRWGLALRGGGYAALCGRWFDDRWAAIPDRYLIYSRNGLNEKALDRIRLEFEGAEAMKVRDPP